MKFISIHNLPSEEDPSKTIKEKNLEREHQYPLDSLVDVKYVERSGYGGVQKIEARMFVFDHMRDCDGTPLYQLSPKPRAELWEGTSVVLGGFSLNSQMSDQIVNHIVTGISEEQISLANGDMSKFEWE